LQKTPCGKNIVRIISLGRTFCYLSVTFGEILASKGVHSSDGLHRPHLDDALPCCDERIGTSANAPPKSAFDIIRESSIIFLHFHTVRV